MPSWETLRQEVESLAARYPKKEAAILPALHLVQRKLGYISPEGEKFVAQVLGVRPVRVREVVTFYTMFSQKPLGKYHLQVCSNLSCTLNGSQTLLDYLREKLGIEPGETTPDGRITLSTVECLGACDQAPCLMVNDDLYGRLDKPKLEALLASLE